MAQKDKIKELVGRGLNSYHTKSLQQIDRIEKKNKEQNHKIGILSNELDDDYLTKTEEGSVVSLEHSKEGMVYLDKLQGNTLVNYCTNSSKEMTLNGDIDVEGTFVTTTEGVDNGLVDVMCEGNTLVNRIGKIISSNHSTNTSNSWNYSFTTEGRGKCTFANKLQNNTTYTVFYKITKNTLTNETNSTVLKFNLNNYNESDKGYFLITLGEVGVFKKVITTSINSTMPNPYIEVSTNLTGGECEVKDIVVLEGESPYSAVEWFEGMKSVGQDDENGHKIEILSQNKNLLTELQNTNENKLGISSSFNNNILTINGVATGNGDFEYQKLDTEIFLKKNTDYTLKYHVVSGDSTRKVFAYKINKLDGTSEWKTAPSGVTTFNSGLDIYSISRIRFYVNEGEIYNNLQLKVQLEEGNVATEHIQGKLNKKEILINEPLRGLPNGVKDQIVKIGGKYFIERKCGEFVLTDSLNYSLGNTNGVPYIQFPFKLGASTDYTTEKKIICNRINTTNVYSSNTNIGVCYVKSDNIRFRLTDSDTLDSFTTWLNQGLTVIVYELVNPIYEPLEIEPTLNTYNDVTHISNNSIIPCDMKIKNTGYNAIIKPSTQYTVALDTNKSGTVGMNLGGAKVTTTNNVATITTPATLADDSLRLYGKDIKGSKVRLLEGDKTNWIPSHFEGMKSSFEDKFDATDNTYKMEILSNNKNLFNINWTKRNSGNGVTYKISNNNIIVDVTDKADAWAGCYMPLVQLQPNTEYSIRCDRINGFGAYIIGIKDSGGSNVADFKEGMEYKSFVTPSNGIVQLRFFSHNTQQNSSYQTIFKNIVLCKGNKIVDYTEPKSNKIQFSSIEPLRSVNKNIRDKFIFKDGKLMIERNCVQRVMENKNWSLNKTVESTKAIQFTNGVMMKSIGAYAKSQEVLCNKKPTLQNDGGKNSIWVYDYQTLVMQMDNNLIKTREDFGDWIESENPIITLPLKEPIYEEIPFELQKIILEGYENGTLFIDTNIPPTSTITYAGETPIVKATKLNKTEVLNNTEDINDNIIPYLMDMDYRVVMLQLAAEELEGGVSMARLFGGTYEMIKRDILSKRLSRQEYGYRLADYFNVGKLTEEQVRELEELR